MWNDWKGPGEMTGALTFALGAGQYGDVKRAGLDYDRWCCVVNPPQIERGRYGDR